MDKHFSRVPHTLSSAFVGLASTLLCIPIPGYITRFSQKIQRQLMRRTDARVQTVSESTWSDFDAGLTWMLTFYWQ